MSGYAHQENRREKEEVDEDAGVLDRLPPPSPPFPVYSRKRDKTGWKFSDPLLAVGIGRVRDGFADFDFALCVPIQQNMYFIYKYIIHLILK